jgi:hypothetical protein
MASTASNTIATQLTDLTDLTPTEAVKCMSFNFKVVLYVSFIILLMCLFMSCINMSLVRKYELDDDMPRSPFKCKRGGCANCILKRRMLRENFENEQTSHGTFTKFEHHQFTNYQSVPLLAPFDENKNPTNLFFGQANRHILTQDGQQSYKLELYCNLLVLDGNIYDKTKTEDIHHAYKVYLIDESSGKKVFLQDLKKDGDGIYKLKFSSDKVQDLIKYNKINIVYSLDGKEEILLQGTFTKIN